MLSVKGKQKGLPQPDPALRDTETVPLQEDVEPYFAREVLPHAPDAWIDHDKTRIGFEIPFNRHFYVFKPPRPLSEIDAELKGVTDPVVASHGMYRSSLRTSSAATLCMSAVTACRLFT